MSVVLVVSMSTGTVTHQAAPWVHKYAREGDLLTACGMLSGENPKPSGTPVTCKRCLRSVRA